VLLVLRHLLVPDDVELLELQHVRLLHSQPLSDLARAHGLLSSVLLVQLQLLQPVLCDLRLHILALALAILAVLLQDLQEVLHGRVFRSVVH